MDNRINKVLIVEGSKIASNQIQSILEKNNFESEVVLEEKDVLTKVFDYGPDLILMDVTPGSDLTGIQLARSIMEKQDVPVIYMTALSGKLSIDNTKLARPYGFLSKPFGDDELINSIDFALKMNGLEKELNENYMGLKTTLDSINDSIIIIDGSNEVVYMNPTAEEMTGHRFSSALKKNIMEILDVRSIDKKPIVLPFTHNDEKGESILPEGIIMNERMRSYKHFGDGRVIPIYDKEIEVKRRVVLFRDISDRVEKVNMERELNQKMQSLLAEENEKNRVKQSQDLHDGIAQVLNVIKFRLESKDDANKDDELVSMIDTAIRDLTSISEEILPSILLKFNLETCIESLCNQMSIQGDIDIQLTTKHLPAELGNTKKIHIYRIVQEGLLNAISHASCKRIEVQLYGYSDFIRMTIEDDGKGFEMNGNYQLDELRNGIRNMTARAENLGGTLSIESNEKYGTVITGQIPYQ